jgi:hypothetical protein
MTGLKPNTTYRYAAVAANSLGEKKGACVSFKTLSTPSQPTILPIEIVSVAKTSVTLKISVNPNGLPTKVTFHDCKGIFPDAPTKVVGTATTPIIVTQTITGLNPGTTYSISAKVEWGLGSMFTTCVIVTTST